MGDYMDDVALKFVPAEVDARGGVTPGAILVGQGPRRVIAVHGWFGGAQSWRRLWPYLDGLNYSYAFMDCRGYESSRHFPGIYTVEEAAQDVLSLANKLDWERFSLLGHSMGGMIIQRVLLDAPARVAALVGVAPVPANGSQLAEPTRLMFEGAVDDVTKRHVIIDRSTGSRLTPTWTVKTAQLSEQAVERIAFGKYLQSWTKTDFHTEVVGNSARVLVVIGQHDPSMDEVRTTETWLDWYPRAEMVILSNSGHYPMDETPIALATVVEAFLTGEGGDTPASVSCVPR